MACLHGGELAQELAYPFLGETDDPADVVSGGYPLYLSNWPERLIETSLPLAHGCSGGDGFRGSSDAMSEPYMTVSREVKTKCPAISSRSPVTPPMPTMISNFAPSTEFLPVTLVPPLSPLK